MINRTEAEKREAGAIAPYACKSVDSRGRRHKEQEHPYRTAYTRDRDRIIHSSAFRRLEYKTQVFVYHEGDYYRTRLTHTLEVAQIARIIARALNLNEDLCEAIALSHDIGHPPFGHSGETALNKLMKDDGGFEHNIHTLRIIDFIERRYKDFRGINLTWETREAVARHAKKENHPSLDEFNDFVNPSLEAQVTDAADSIAYISHDLDDGLKSGLITSQMLDDVKIWVQAKQKAKEQGDLSSDMANFQIIRNIIDLQVTGLILHTEKNIERLRITSPDDVRNSQALVAEFTQELKKLRGELSQFLREKMYKHNRVIRMEDKAYRVVGELFAAYDNRPQLLPDHVYKNLDEVGKRQLICDYVAGMTDRFALEDHRKLFDPMSRA